jgi:hypothetical protein
LVGQVAEVRWLRERAEAQWWAARPGVRRVGASTFAFRLRIFA